MEAIGVLLVAAIFIGLAAVVAVERNADKRG